MRIVYVLDKNYAEYARISIQSYLKYNRHALVTVVSEEPLPKDIGYDENIVMDLRGFDFRKKCDNDRISNSAFLKLFLTKLPYHKILYVDADTVCQKPLDELWEIPCKYINLCESHKYGVRQAEALGLEKYGLTGMMMMNLDNLRDIGFTERCLEVQKLDIQNEFWQHDETCINVGMKGMLKFIDKKYNYCRSREYDEPINEEDAYILHYVGSVKDGPFSCIHYPELYALKDEIEGKRVAIVGNAESLFDKEYGREIDSNDFVIRFSKGFVTQPKSQGSKTSLLFLSCILSDEQIKSYKTKYVANRSVNYPNKADFTINNRDRGIMKAGLGSQPSSGFMAVNICLYFRAKEINLYGFDWGKTRTFYNDPSYQTQHDYKKENEVITGYESVGLLKIH